MSGRGWATAGAVVSAAASSACCWLPILMVATGVSAVGAAAFFERFRLLFLGGAGVLLAFGFYLNYRPAREQCGSGGSCAAPNRGLKRLNRGMLWFSAALVALFALFPNYVGSLVATAGPAPAKAVTVDRLALGIEGMTCAGCEAGVSASLAKLPGVRVVSTSHANGQAVVEVEAGAVPERTALAAALGKAGYELTSVAQAAGEEPAPLFTGQWTVGLPHENDGETTELVVDLGQLNERWVGEFDLLDYGVENYPVEVSVSGEEATLFLTAIGMEFIGTVSPEGQTLSGIGTSQGGEETIVFARSRNAPQFSPDFLELESVAADPALVERLSASGKELRDRFNADKNKVRLIALLSPT